MQVRWTIFSTLLCFILILGCKKDSEIITIDRDIPEPVVLIEAQVKGFVSDRSGEPIMDAKVQFGANEVQTDATGNFIVSGLVNEAAAVVKIEKAGYFSNIRTFKADPAGTAQVRVNLTERALVGNFTSDAGGKVTLPSGAAIDFAPDGFVDEAGHPYVGNVQVYATYLDPTWPDLAEVMPGDLTAINADNQLQVLQTFGMLNVEIESSTGAPLQINAPAELVMPVPAELLGQAPSEIPLWYFAEASGRWLEEGTAQLQGDRYVGTVNHFTFWNCDVPSDMVELSGTIATDKYEIQVEVRATNLSNGSTASTYTDSEGFFTGFVPQNVPLLLEVFSSCGTVLYSENISALTANYSIGTVEIALDENWLIIRGTLLNCDLNPTTEGLAIVVFDGGGGIYNFSTDENGLFEGAIYDCGSTSLTVTPFDIAGEQIGAEVNAAAASPIDLGQLVACGTSFTTEVIFNLNGSTYIIDNCTATVDRSNPPVTIHTLTTIDQFSPGNEMQYGFNFLDWNENPDDPLWGLSTETIEIGTVDKHFTFAGIDNISAPVYSDSPGGVIIFTFTVATLTDEVSNETYTDVQVILKAIIQ